MLKFSLQNSLQSFESFILIWCERLPDTFDQAPLNGSDEALK